MAVFPATANSRLPVYPLVGPGSSGVNPSTMTPVPVPAGAMAGPAVPPAASERMFSAGVRVSQSVPTSPAVVPSIPQRAQALAPATQHSVHSDPGHKTHPKALPAKPAGLLHGLNPLVLTAAATALVAAPVMLVTGALGMHMARDEITRKMVSRHRGGAIYEAVKTILPGLTPERIKSSYDLANKFLSLALIPKSAVVIQYGLNTGQPTAVLSGLAQMAVGPALMWKHSPLQSNFNYLVGALQTVGFANDVQNNFLLDDDRPMKNFYNFRHLGRAFDPHSDLTGKERLKTISHESRQLTRYLVHDQVYTVSKAGQLLKDTARTLFNGVVHPFQTETQLKHSLKQIHPHHPKAADVTTTDEPQEPSHHQGNPNLSRLFVTMAYAGLAPVFLAPLASPVLRPVLSKISPSLLNPALLIGDASFIAIGLGGKSLLDKAPAVGQTIELVGTKLGSLANAGQSARTVSAFAMTSGAIAGALQQFGAAINLLYFGSRQKKESQTHRDT